MKFGLIGETLGHSLSPQIHQCIFKLAGLPGHNEYDLLEIGRSALPDTFRQLSHSYQPMNVTIPYKVEIMPLLQGIAPAAARIGAINTIQIRPDGCFGYNTDYIGFSRALDHAGIHLEGKDAVVLGSGGAARAILQSLFDKGARHITVVTRYPEREKEDFTALARRLSLEIIGYEELAARPGQDLLVNCTPVGMYPKSDASPVPETVAARYGAIVDAVYNPKETKLLSWGRKHGALTQNGLYMLVSQAVAAEEIWLDRPMDKVIVDKIVQEMESLL